MNTRASVAYGWGILCLAGGGAYYFAKRSINSDRADRAAAEEARRQQRERLRMTESASRDAHLGQAPKKRAPNADKVRNGDPAPVEHESGRGTADPVAPVVHSESKYEAKDPFRSRKGDRFS